MLQEKRQGVGGLLSVPFPLTLSPGQLLALSHLSNLRAHRGLIEGWYLEGCAEVPSGVSPTMSTIRPGLESDPAARLGPADHRRIHGCPAHPVPKPICLREGQANSYSAGARLAWQEELAATALASLTPALLKGQCCSPLALFPPSGRAGPTMGQGPRDIHRLPVPSGDWVSA